jgi:hypothetical protein
VRRQVPLDQHAHVAERGELHDAGDCERSRQPLGPVRPCPVGHLRGGQVNPQLSFFSNTSLSGRTSSTVMAISPSSEKADSNAAISTVHPISCADVHERYEISVAGCDHEYRAFLGNF